MLLEEVCKALSRMVDDCKRGDFEDATLEGVVHGETAYMTLDIFDEKFAIRITKLEKEGS